MKHWEESALYFLLPLEYVSIHMDLTHKRASCFYKFSLIEVIAVDVCFAQWRISCKLQQKYLSKTVRAFWMPVSQAGGIIIDVN